MRIAAGADLNILSRALRNNPAALVFSPAASTKFPARNAADGIVAKYVQWAVVSADPGDPEAEDPTLARKATCDTNLVKNPGAESGLAGWKKAPSTTASSSSAQFNSGTKSFSITGHATDLRYVYQDVPMRSGESARARAATRGNGTQSASFRVKNLDTSKYLQANGTWAEAVADLGLTSAAAWTSPTTNAVSFTVEAFEETLKHQTLFRFELHATGAGAVFVDDAELVVAVDGSSVHGVGFPRSMAPTIYSSDTGAFGGEEVARFVMDPFQPSFYSLLAAPVLARYWRFELPGVREATFKPWMGEWFLVQTVHLLSSAGHDFSSRYGSEMRHGWTAAKAARATRNLNLPFRWFSDAWPQAREWFILRTLGTDGTKKPKAGQEVRRIWIVAPEFEDKMVIFGVMQSEVGYNLASPGAADGGISIIEDPFPSPPKGEYF